jgi:hypothetical protein
MTTLVTGQWFSSGTPISSNNKTDRNDITEILMKMALNTLSLNQTIPETNLMVSVLASIAVDFWLS